jgi:glycosyltransferase involved in cell wall biosynthesis
VLTRENNRSRSRLRSTPSPDWICIRSILTYLIGLAGGRRGNGSVHVLLSCGRRLARKACERSFMKQQQFDVAHHITFAVDSLPAGVVGIRGLPSVWGPVGGAAPFMWRYARWLGVRGLVAELTRSMVTGVTRRTFGDRAAARADLVVAQNDHVARRFSGTNVLIEPNIAMITAQDSFTKPARYRNGDPVMIFVGRLIPLKGVVLAVAVLAAMSDSSWTLVILGDGPDRRRIERFARQMAVDHRIELLGQVNREQVGQELRNADVMIFPSLHDAAPWSVAEALVAGVPVVALELCGPPTIVSRTGGGICVSADVKNPVRALADSVTAIVECHDGADLTPLSIDRLPDLVTSWYRTVAVR